MRTPVGSSNSVARSRLQSSPAWEPSDVIFTFCASAGAQASAAMATRNAVERDMAAPSVMGRRASRNRLPSRARQILRGPMDKRKLGSTGFDVAPLAFGGNVFGWTADEPTSFALLDRFVGAGF